MTESKKGASGPKQQTSKTTGKPLLAPILILAGVLWNIFTIILIVAISTGNYPGTAVPTQNSYIAGLVMAIVLIAVSIVAIVCAVKIRNLADRKLVKKWSMIGIVVAVLTFLVSLTLSWLGAVLIGVGAVIALYKS